IAVLGLPPAPPVITGPASITGTVGTPVSVQIVATNSPTGYSVVSGTLPSGLALNPTTGLITGTPTAVASTTVTFGATNASGTGTSAIPVTINPPAPVITSALTANGTVGSAFSYQIVATNSPTSYSATGLPSGLGINPTTGLISGTPTAVANNPPASVTIGATNAGGSDSKTLVITINPPAPVITSALTASGTVGTAFSYQIVATNNPTSYSASGLPSGLGINPTTGLISGTPTAVANNPPASVTIGATNAGGSDSKTLVITINPVSADTNQALNQPATASSFQVGNEVAKGNNASLTDRWAAANGTFPAWWRVDLGTSKVLSRVDIMWLNPTTRAYKYKLEASTDDVNYNMVFDNTNNTTFGNTSNPITATARYVRVTVTGSSNGGFASFFDVKVFGH
ncbi:MAG: putative Ig domain-containing protein, partial [Chthoniobacterales bacterium]